MYLRLKKSRLKVAMAGSCQLKIICLQMAPRVIKTIFLIIAKFFIINAQESAKVGCIPFDMFCQSVGKI